METYLKVEDIESVEEIESEDNFYDFKVPFDECYIITKDDIVSHNSGKTYSIIQYLMYLALSTDAKKNPLYFTIVRKWLPSLKESTYLDFQEIITKYGYYDEVNHNKTELKYVLNGHTFKFLATGDQPERLRSMKRDILYINEVSELTKEEFRQLNFRTTTKVIMDYNPSMSEHWVYDLEDNRPDDVDVFHSTYKDNSFLSDSQVKEIEELQKSDPESWRVYGEGKRATLRKGRIFKGWEQIQEIPDGAVFYGLDFGYHPDPTALIKITSANDSIYLEELMYSTKTMDEDIMRVLRNNGYAGEPIYCDHNQLATIEQLRRAGFNAKQGRKGSGSVIDGINFLKRATVFVHHRSSNLIKEYNAYSWKLKKGFDPDDADAYEQYPEDKNNHGIDSVRLAYYSHYFVGQKFFVV